MGLVAVLGAYLPSQHPYSLFCLLLVIPVLVLFQLSRPLWEAGSPDIDNAPRLGVPSHAWFSTIRTKIQYIQNGFHMIHQGYRNVQLDSS